MGNIIQSKNTNLRIDHDYCWSGFDRLLCSVLNPGSTIYESRPEGGCNHKAVLRMRTNRISELTGIEFKKVTVKANQKR